jgi:hypothetical protein
MKNAQNYWGLSPEDQDEAQEETESRTEEEHQEFYVRFPATAPSLDDVMWSAGLDSDEF